MEQRSNITDPVDVTSSERADPAASADAPDSSAAPAVSPAPATLAFDEAYNRAGFWLRLIALGIDTAVLGAFAFLLMIVGVLTLLISGGLGDFAGEADDIFPLFPLWTAALLTASAAYFTILHSEYGQTIGKSLIGIEVRSRDGALLDYSQALFRWLAYGVSAAFFGLGFLWVALTPGKRGWHDVLANTVVVTPKQPQ